MYECMLENGKLGHIPDGWEPIRAFRQAIVFYFAYDKPDMISPIRCRKNLAGSRQFYIIFKTHTFPLRYCFSEMSTFK